MTVRARGLELRHGGRIVLTGLDLDVAAGDIVGLLGPNGAGKTSALRLLATGRRPAAGTLVILEHDARRPTAALRRRIGVAGDEPVHVDAMTGWENAVCFARAAGLSRDVAAARVRGLLDRFALGGDAHRPVAEYSLGMRRRLLLVEALAHAPALLVLDEPTTSLDLEGRAILTAVLRERAGSGAGVVLATNDLGFAEGMCDRVVFLRDGRPVLEGRPRDLIARLGGDTTFEFTLAAPAPPEVRCDGVEIALATADRLVARSVAGSAPLPALCEAILRAGAAIVSVTVRRPDLRDVVLRATGEVPAAA